MAASLNGNRILFTRILGVGSLALMALSAPHIGEAHGLHVPLKIAGVMLVFICVIGRLYSTAFLGGFKNQKLITHGIYSVMRNPLYFFSLVGISGIALFTGNLILMIVLPLTLFLVYQPLIKREEQFLEEAFGQEYRIYRDQIPALYPRVSLYQAPETIEMVPKYLAKAMKDAVWWALALPVIEVLHYSQASGILPTFF